MAIWSPSFQTGMQRPSYICYCLLPLAAAAFASPPLPSLISKKGSFLLNLTFHLPARLNLPAASDTHQREAVEAGRKACSVETSSVGSGEQKRCVLAAVLTADRLRETQLLQLQYREEVALPSPHPQLGPGRRNPYCKVVRTWIYGRQN